MKKIIALLIVFALCCSALVGCGSKENTIQNDNTPTTENKNVNSVDDNTMTEEPQSNQSIKKVSLKEEFSINDIMTVSLNYAEWCNDILPSNTSNGYLYKKGTEGEMFFVVHGTLKNLASKEFDIRYCSSGEMLINGKYKVPISLELEESGGTSFSASVKPLQTLNLIVYGSVSEELYNSYENADITINIVNSEENLSYFYNDDYSHDTFLISFSK